MPRASPWWLHTPPMQAHGSPHKGSPWSSFVSTEPSAVTHPRRSGNSEPLKPDIVIAQRSSHTLHHIMQSRNSHSHSEQGICSQPCEPASSMETAKVPRACCLAVFCLDSLSLDTHDSEGRGTPHRLKWVPCQTLQATVGTTDLSL